MSKKSLVIIISSIAVAILAIVLSFVFQNNNVKYTVTFNSDGGTLVEEQIIKKGDKVVRPTDPTKEGYKFISWTYQDKIYDFSLEVTSDIQLKANWHELKEAVKMYTVKFNNDGGTTYENQIVEEGNKVVRPTDPTKEGHDFKGWYLNGNEYDFELGVTKDIELEAKWEKVNVPENNNSSNSGSNTSNQSKEENIKVEAPTLSHTTGYATGGVIKTGLHIVVEGIYADLNKMNSIAGWELYEKVGNNYNLVGSSQKDKIEVTVDIGETKTFVAKVYKLNKNNQKIFSAYSNELKIDNISN